MFAFDKRINKTEEEIEYTVEYKFDGLTICLTYEDGKFSRATTRGNGVVGEDVTAQVLTIKSFPLTINFKGKIEVQGEAVMRLSVLEEYNKTEKEIRKAIGNNQYSSYLFRFPGGFEGGRYEKIKKEDPASYETIKAVLEDNQRVYFFKMMKDVRNLSMIINMITVNQYIFGSTQMRME